MHKFWATIHKANEAKTWLVTPGWSLKLTGAVLVDGPGGDTSCVVSLQPTYLTPTDEDSEGGEEIVQPKTAILHLSSTTVNTAIMRNIDFDTECRLTIDVSCSLNGGPDDFQVHLSGYMSRIDDDEDMEEIPYLESTRRTQSDTHTGEIFSSAAIVEAPLGSYLREPTKCAQAHTSANKEEVPGDSSKTKGCGKQENMTKNGKTKPPIEDSSTKLPKAKSENFGKRSPAIKRSLPSGVKYEITTVGHGAVAKPGKRVRVRYEGRLAKTGKRFDKGQVEFTVGGGEMIKGFDEGVLGMLLKESRTIYIPSALGYGMRPTAKIPGGSDLIFHIILLNVKNF